MDCADGESDRPNAVVGVAMKSTVLDMVLLLLSDAIVFGLVFRGCLQGMCVKASGVTGVTGGEGHRWWRLTIPKSVIWELVSGSTSVAI